MTQPALLLVRASLDSVRAALVGVGAVAQHRRSVALDLGDDLLVLGFDRDDHVTTVAVGGSTDPMRTARWLANQLDDLGRPVQGILPPIARHRTLREVSQLPAARIPPAVAGYSTVTGS